MVRTICGVNSNPTRIIAVKAQHHRSGVWLLSGTGFGLLAELPEELQGVPELP